jgi:YCII-related domain
MMNGLNHEKAPPPELKQRVIRSLENRGLLGRQPRIWRMVGAAAAAAAVFVAGVLAGHRAQGSSAFASGPRWALLLYEGPGFQPATVEADRVAEYRAWAMRLRAEGALELGEELAPEQRLLGSAPAGEPGAAMVAGLFIIDAPDLARAVAIAGTCPHLRYGGGIAVRRIAGT